ncbi:MAG: SpoIIE family protein phosphatase [Phycisphaeraceae bacterium]
MTCTYFSPTHQLLGVNAGHPRPLWWVAKRGEWRFLEASVGESQGYGPRNLPLGVIGETGYRQFVVTLEPGDVVMMYTDSLMEATPGTGGRMLGGEGIVGDGADVRGGCKDRQAAPGNGPRKL